MYTCYWSIPEWRNEEVRRSPKKNFMLKGLWSEVNVLLSEHLTATLIKGSWLVVVAGVFLIHIHYFGEVH